MNRRWAAIWIAALLVPASLEVWALTTATPGDTLSAQVWALVDAYPAFKIVIGAGLVWLGIHWLRRP